jgi:hypothetical protein
MSAVQYKDIMTWKSDGIFPCIKSHILMHFIQKQYLVHQHPNFWECDIVGNWDSSVSVAARLQVVSLRNCYWMSSKDKRFISPSLCKTGSGIHSISYSVVTVVTSVGLKLLGFEADLSPPSSAEVENECSFTWTLSYTFVVAKCQFPLHPMIFLDATSWLSGNTLDSYWGVLHLYLTQETSYSKHSNGYFQSLPANAIGVP